MRIATRHASLPETFPYNSSHAYTYLRLVMGCTYIVKAAVNYENEIVLLIGVEYKLFYCIDANFAHSMEHTSPFTSFVAWPKATESDRLPISLLWFHQSARCVGRMLPVHFHRLVGWLMLFLSGKVCTDAMPTTHAIVLTPFSLITGLSFTCAFGATGFSPVTLRRSPHASLNMKLFDWKKRAAFDHIVIPPSKLRLFVAHLTV